MVLGGGSTMVLGGPTMVLEVPPWGWGEEVPLQTFRFTDLSILSTNLPVISNRCTDRSRFFRYKLTGDVIGVGVGCDTLPQSSPLRP